MFISGRIFNFQSLIFLEGFVVSCILILGLGEFCGE